MIKLNKLENLSTVETILWDWNGTLLDGVELNLSVPNAFW